MVSCSSLCLFWDKLFSFLLMTQLPPALLSGVLGLLRQCVFSPRKWLCSHWHPQRECGGPTHLPSNSLHMGISVLLPFLIVLHWTQHVSTQKSFCPSPHWIPSSGWVCRARFDPEQLAGCPASSSDITYLLITRYRFYVHPVTKYITY